MNRLEHTPFGWRVFRGRLVLFRAYKLYLLWYLLCGFVLLHLISKLTMFPAVAIRGGIEHVQTVHYIMYGLYISGLVLAVYGLYGFARAKTVVWFPAKLVSIGSGWQCKIVDRHDPIPTSMGGTLPGPFTKWLVLTHESGSIKRLLQVYHDIDLWTINRSLKQNVEAVV